MPAAERRMNRVTEAGMLKQFKHVNGEEAIRMMVEFGLVAYTAMIVLKVITSYSLF